MYDAEEDKEKEEEAGSAKCREGREEEELVGSLEEKGKVDQ